ncbi:MAG: 2-amino-4-hydroxy-6-hydroxymethyldihydropteridine diphosphokinase [Lysobacter sp.]
MNATTIAFVGLGGNVGDAATILRDAFAALGRLSGMRLLRASRLYRTPAWGVTSQADFINAVAMIETTLAPPVLLANLMQIERDAGRDRLAGATVWGPRTLDLDLLLYGDKIIDVPGLKVPHPHLHERAFALVPLVEIAPDTRIPGHGAAADALASMAIGDIQAIG